MVVVGIRELKNRFSVYIKRVQGGERVVVTWRRKIVAELVPRTVEAEADEQPHGKEGTARDGVLRPGVCCQCATPHAAWQEEVLGEVRSKLLQVNDLTSKLLLIVDGLTVREHSTSQSPLTASGGHLIEPSPHQTPVLDTRAAVASQSQPEKVQVIAGEELYVPRTTRDQFWWGDERNGIPVLPRSPFQGVRTVTLSELEGTVVDVVRAVQEGWYVVVMQDGNPIAKVIPRASDVGDKVITSEHVKRLLDGE